MHSNTRVQKVPMTLLPTDLTSQTELDKGHLVSGKSTEGHLHIN